MRTLLRAVMVPVASLLAATVLTGCWERPPITTVQNGYRGLGMVGIYNPRTLEGQMPANVVPAALPPASPPAGASGTAQAAVEPAPVLYRHGMRVTFEGSYFEVRDYLRSIEGGDWRLFWERLDYQVGEAGPGRARITLELYTLSREAGWVGV